MKVERLVFLDETGVKLGMGRRTGWSKRGEPCLIKRKLWSSNYSLVAALGLDGMRAGMLIQGAIDGPSFLAYLRDALVPELNPGDILVMDNLRVHKVAGVRDLVESAGASVLYLPPYSPELNPIELVWAKFKSAIRTVMPRTMTALQRILNDCFHSLTREQASAWFQHCGYSVQPH